MFFNLKHWHNVQHQFLCLCLNTKGKLTLYAGVDNVRWKSVVRPGDRLEMHVETTKVKGPICKCHGVGYVDGKVAIEADLTVALK